MLAKDVANPDKDKHLWKKDAVEQAIRLKRKAR